ncbi:hypothetical protein MLD38_004286 [Melastoma candidum]|uniref:Uncharacterized protein n=1 Tax=Melastoma candidum TaxID=119954 RepID=A0ACB9S6R3_9MYRT|nr:hypothetical protein MLD38_004286 [Melastoma candidum]
MVREGNGRLLGKGEVEEGEISDSASLEEITEADFRKQDVKGAAVGEGGAPKARVWTMQDLYKYQIKRGYTSGLHNLAWAQAVKNKPLNEVLDMEDGSSMKGEGKDVIDECSDEVLEKEEGEIEEGEFGMEIDSGSKENKEESSKDMKLEDGDDVCETEIDMDEDEIGQRLFSFQEALDSVMSVNAEISFEEVCCQLHNCLENLRKVVLVKDLPAKDALVELFFSAVQSVYSDLCSLNEGQKDLNKENFLRFLSQVKSNRPSFLSAEQRIEVEDMVRAITPVSALSTSKSRDGDEEVQSSKLTAEKSLDPSAGDPATAKLVPSDSLAVQSAAVNQRTFAVEGPRNGLARGRGMSLPLLDLHKDHDEDSLPSPTQRAPSSIPFPRATVVDSVFKQRVDVSKLWPEREEERVLPLPYENDALKAVSSYQQKFGRSSFFSFDDLPSPTPSEEHDNQGGDTGSEISSSTAPMSKSLSVPVLGRPSPALISHNDKPATQGPSATQVVSATASTPSQPGKPSLKSRDPRLRFASPDSGAADVNQRHMSVTSTALKADPVGVTMASTKECISESLIVNGPPLKRPKNGLENAGIINGVKSGGWIDGSDSSSGGFQLNNRHQFAERPSDPRKGNNGVMPSNYIAKANSNLVNGNGMPGSMVIQPENSGVPSGGVSASLPALLKGIAVDPTLLMNIIKMGQQGSAGDAAIDPSKIMGSLWSSNPATGATAKPSALPLVGAGLLHKPPVTPNTVAQTDQDELVKARMKPRDPRRFLQGNAIARSNTSASELSKCGPPMPRAFDPAGSKSLPSDTKSISPALTSQSVAVPNVPLNPVQVPSGADGKAVPSTGDVPTGAAPVREFRFVEATTSPDPWGNLQHIIDGYDDKQRAAIHKERARRIEEQNKMFAARKLCLVLDLDHTLLNSAKFVEVDMVHEELLRKKEEIDREKPLRHLFRFNHMEMWTKLRPGIWTFLEKASKLYELHLYTMGNKMYATEMAKVLDPKGVLFAGRVISRGDDNGTVDGDERYPKSKDLEGVLGMESAVVIIDDSVRVWPHNKLNLIMVERYTYFPCSRRQFGLLGPSLLEIDHDERPEDGTLASALAVIERIHENFFTHKSLDEADVRNILAEEQRKILGGCRVVFSRIFPVGEANPHLHPLWQTAEQFGAVCTNQIDEQVTHVVANAPGTDKVNWAVANGKFVVHPAWVEASALLYRRANEQDFAIKI